MAKRRGTGATLASKRAERSNSDGAKALSMWSNHGCIIQRETSAGSRSGHKRSATRRRTVTGSVPEQQTNRDKLGGFMKREP